LNYSYIDFTPSLLCKARFDTFTIVQLRNTCSGIVMPLQYACICILVIDKYIVLVIYRFNARCTNDLMYLSVFYKFKLCIACPSICCTHYAFNP